MRLHSYVSITVLYFISLILLPESTKLPFACDSSKSLPFCQTSVPITQRAQDLVSRLTLEEKVAQLGNSAPAIPRLGIPAYEWWSEALHGVTNGGVLEMGLGIKLGVELKGKIKEATSFPQVILTAATFDAHLWYRIGQVRQSFTQFYLLTPMTSCGTKCVSPSLYN